MKFTRGELKYMSNQNEIFKDYVERTYSNARIGFKDMTEVEFDELTRLYGEKGFVLCLPTPYNTDYEDKSIFKDHSFFSIKDVNRREFDAQSPYFNTIIDALVHNHTPLPLIPNPYIKDQFLVESNRREYAEYNPHYWQLVVCGLVVCKDGIVLLKNNGDHPRLPNMITMIQGHVDAKKEMHMMSSYEYLTREYVREIREELNIPKLSDEELWVSSTLAGAIQVSTDEVSMDHLGLFYMTDIRGEDISAHDITSNESRHVPVVYNKVVDIIIEPVKDSWVTPLVDAFVKNKLIK